MWNQTHPQNNSIEFGMKSTYENPNPLARFLYKSFYKYLHPTPYANSYIEGTAKRFYEIWTPTEFMYGKYKRRKDTAPLQDIYIEKTSNMWLQKCTTPYVPSCTKEWQMRDYKKKEPPPKICMTKNWEDIYKLCVTPYAILMAESLAEEVYKKLGAPMDFLYRLGTRSAYKKLTPLLKNCKRNW